MLRTTFCAILLGTSALALANTTITYQGQLQHNGEPFDGTIPAADITFELFDDPDPAVGVSIAGPINPPDDIQVADGLFQTELDFGDVHDGNGWLEIKIDGTALSPRQPILASPFAIRALNVADGVSGVWEKSGDNIQYAANQQILAFMPDGDPDWGPRIVMGHAANEASARGATVSGGGNGGSSPFPNRALARYATVAGGRGNSVTGFGGTVSGGGSNSAGHGAAVSGGSFNTADTFRSAIGGGSSNTTWDRFGTVSGGQSNRAGSNDGDSQTAEYATVGGGQGNRALAEHATIAGGSDNTASGDGATVSGGGQNEATESATAIGGGISNTASQLAATVGGGAGNEASGMYSSVPGGMSNLAAGRFSMAAGRQAKAQHDGAFVWADSTIADFFSTAENQFRVRAYGGAEFETGAVGLKAFSNSDSTSGAAIQAQSTNPSGIALVGRNKSDDATLALNNTGTGPLIRAFSGNTLLLELENNGDMTIDGNLTENSDRYSKEAIRPINAEEILSRLADLEISTWRYKDNPEGVRHIGPMAQDFHAAFGFGGSETSISGMDVRGVALAAIQALHEQNLALTKRLEEFRQTNAALQAQVESLAQARDESRELHERIAALEDLLLYQAQSAQTAPKPLSQR